MIRAPSVSKPVAQGQHFTPMPAHQTARVPDGGLAAFATSPTAVPLRGQASRDSMGPRRFSGGSQLVPLVLEDPQGNSRARGCQRFACQHPALVGLAVVTGLMAFTGLILAAYAVGRVHLLADALVRQLNRQGDPTAAGSAQIR